MLLRSEENEKTMEADAKLTGTGQQEAPASAQVRIVHPSINFCLTMLGLWGPQPEQGGEDQGVLKPAE